MIRYYQFADVNFAVQGLPETVSDGKYLKLFRCNSPVSDIMIYVKEDKLILPFDAVRSGDIHYIERNGKYILFNRFRTPNPAVVFALSDWKKSEITVRVHPELIEDTAFTVNWLLSLSGFYSGLLYRHRITFHCSYILVKNQAILFAGFSGMGKSTQAELWKRYRDSFTVNGDRALIFRREDGWYAGGVSVCGSSKICRNHTARIAAVIFLEKGPDNTVLSMSASEKYRGLLTGMAFHRWSREEVEIAEEMAMGIMTDLPIYRLRNRADEESVRVLEQVIGGTLYDI